MHTKEPIVREDDLAALEQSKQAGYELRDYQLGPIIWTLVALTALAIAGFALMIFTFKSFEKVAPFVQKSEAYTNLSYPVKSTTQHRLTVDIDHELAQARAEWVKNTQHYGVADQAAGVGRVPVDRALEIIAEKGGLPVFGAGGTITFPDRPAASDSAHTTAPGTPVGAAAPASAGEAASPASPASPAPGFQPQFEPQVHQAFPEGQH